MMASRRVQTFLLLLLSSFIHGTMTRSPVLPLLTNPAYNPLTIAQQMMANNPVGKTSPSAVPIPLAGGDRRAPGSQHASVIILLKHAKGLHILLFANPEDGTWGPPGVWLKEGEDKEQAVIRGLREKSHHTMWLNWQERGVFPRHVPVVDDGHSYYDFVKMVSIPGDETRVLSRLVVEMMGEVSDSKELVGLALLDVATLRDDEPVQNNLNFAEQFIMRVQSGYQAPHDFLKWSGVDVIGTGALEPVRLIHLSAPFLRRFRTNKSKYLAAFEKVTLLYSSQLKMALAAENRRAPGSKHASAIILLKHAKGLLILMFAKEDGTWGPPGVWLKEGENEEQGAIRALREKSHHTMWFNWQEREKKHGVFPRHVSVVDDGYNYYDFVKMVSINPGDETRVLRGLVVEMMGEVPDSKELVGLALLDVATLGDDEPVQKNLDFAQQYSMSVRNGYHSPYALQKWSGVDVIGTGALEPVQKAVLDAPFLRRFRTNKSKYLDAFKKLKVLEDESHPVEIEDYSRSASVIIVVKYAGIDCVLLGREAGSNHQAYNAFGGTSGPGELSEETAAREMLEESEILYIPAEELAKYAAIVQHPSYYNPIHELKKKKVHFAYIFRSLLNEEGLWRLVMKMLLTNHKSIYDREITGIALLPMDRTCFNPPEFKLLEIAKKCQGQELMREKDTECVVEAVAGYQFEHDTVTGYGKKLEEIVEGTKLNIRYVFMRALGSHEQYAVKMQEVAQKGKILNFKKFDLPEGYSYATWKARKDRSKL